MKRAIVATFVVGLAAGCGGGGGGGGGDDWISFSPGSLHATVYAGESTQWLEVSGTARSVPSVQVNIGVVVDGSLLDDQRLIEVDDMTRTLRVRVKAGLSQGTHRGNIEVRACQDDPLVCHRPYGGSPFHVPLTVTVAPDPGYPTSPVNGDFAAGTSGWTTYRAGTAAASLSTSEGALHVAIADGGAAYYEVQVYDTPGIDVEAGKTYRLEFDAWADDARTIRVSVQENGRDLDTLPSPYNTYLEDGLAPISLTTAPQHFEYEWVQPVTNRKADVDFFVGGSSADVFIDDVTVTELDP